MDIATIVGLFATFGLMLYGILLGSPLTIFWDLPSFLIVVGGSVGIILINYPLNDVLASVRIAKKGFFHQEIIIGDVIMQLLDFAGKARKNGILSLQGDIDQLEDPFLIKALQMAVDGQEPDELKAMLVTEITHIEERHSKGSEFFASLGSIAPAMGMIGTLIGLVQMLQAMNDASAIGPALAVALITTFYGSVIANIICIPMSGKLKHRSDSEVLYKNIIVEGMGAILAGENPRVMEQRLHAFLAPRDRESVFNK
ncbi:MAG: motility protein A [Desulfobulbaceae bacterium A2]|nr:MAG: motility protein A [Desulfobulbaceae bacterium A2]